MELFESLNKIDEILSIRYPTQEELEQLPLGKKLVKLDKMAWTNEMRSITLETSELELTNDEITEHLKEKNQILGNEFVSDVFHRHITGCMEGIRILTTSGAISPFFEKFQMGLDPFRSFQSFLTGLSEFDRKFLRFITLYHDIGKVIHRDKHPMLGKHILESIEDEERKRFIDILEDESYFYMMLELVGHHDLFGTACTGESSRTTLIEASGLRLKKIQEAKKTIDYIVILNLSDIYGTIGPIPDDRITIIVNEQVFFDNIIQNKDLRESPIISKSELENRIIKSEQEPERTAERLKKILISAIKYGKDKSIKLEIRNKLCKKVTTDMIRSTLVKLLGPELQSFCKDFALVCKLDYGLRFMTSLADKWILHNGITTVEMIDNCRLENLATIVLEILIRLVRCYSDLTRQIDGGWREIGIELLSLSRSQEISDQIISRLLLGERRAEGVNWLADEITAWYYL